MSDRDVQKQSGNKISVIKYRATTIIHPTYQKLKTAQVFRMDVQLRQRNLDEQERQIEGKKYGPLLSIRNGSSLA